MQTAVSATLLILGALECSGQYYHGPVTAYHNYNPPQQNQRPGNGYAGNVGDANSQSPYPINSSPPPGQRTASSKGGAFRLNNPLPSPSASKSSDKPWQYPSPETSDPTQVPLTSGNRRTSPQINPAQESALEAAADPSRWGLMSSTRRPTTRRKASKTSTTSRTQPEQYAVSTSSPSSGDKVLFINPGGNAAGSTHDVLAVVDEEDVADSAVNINKGLRQFALDLLMDMINVSPDKNVVLSPYSVWAVMLVIYEGAEGETARQIASTLKFSDKKKKVRSNYKKLEYALRKANNESHSDFLSGNGIFYDSNRPPNYEFEKFALSDYQCRLQSVDFSNVSSAVKTINDWVSSVTNKRIRMLVKSEDIGRPELIITNALFFKGQWKIPFNLSATHTDRFYNEKKEHIADVRMMYQKGAYMYSFISEIGAHVLDMPYEDSKFRMLVVLPKPTSTVGEVLKLMKQFPVDLCYERLVREQEMFAEDEVHVYLPRFKFGNRIELKPNLRRLGIRDVFESGVANLSAMSPLQLNLGKVFHVSEIEVTEEGTIASAATAGGFVNKMGPPKFLANRPFAYFIVENLQKTVIFAGKVADPNKKMSS